MQVAKSMFFAAAAAAVAIFSTGAAHANLVTNGGFETGDFAGWTTAVSPTFDGVDNLSPQAGTFAAYFGNPSGTSTISQTLATVAGSTYDVTFWLKNEADANGSSTPNSFEFDWDGAAVLMLVNAPASPYTKYQFFLSAVSASTAMNFKFSQTPAFWDFDSVDAHDVPEPGSLALASLAGMLGLVVSNRRRSSRSGADALAT